MKQFPKNEMETTNKNMNKIQHPWPSENLKFKLQRHSIASKSGLQSLGKHTPTDTDKDGKKRNHYITLVGT